MKRDLFTRKDFYSDTLAVIEPRNRVQG